MKKKITIIVTVSFFLLLLIFPSITLAGAKNGLMLWFQTVLPTLLPFLIVSNLFVQFHITDYLCAILYPIIGKPLRITKNACYPVLIGLLSGLPIGAKACADLVKSEQISLDEGQYLLCFCNNASPMFILSYIAISCLGRPDLSYVILLLIVISGIFSGIVYRLTLGRQKQSRTDITLSSSQTAISIENAPAFVVLDNTIMNAFGTITKIGGYIILFSILAEVFKYIPGIPETIRYFLIGCFELTTGCAALKAGHISFLKKIILIHFLTAFGGLSAIVQTNSVLIHSGLSIRIYFIFKLISGGFAALLSLLLINII